MPSDALPRTESCLNCGRKVTGLFCASCGQETTDRTVSLKLLIADLLSDVASLDSKLFRTLSTLLFRPGLLTTEIIAGRRVRYHTPFKLYLGVSAVFFLLASLTAEPMGREIPATPTPLEPSRDSEASPALVEAGAASGTPAGSEGAILPLGEAGAQRGLHLKLERNEVRVLGLPASEDEYETQQSQIPVGERDTRLEAWILKRAIQHQRMGVEELGRRVTERFPQMMFFMVPAFALLLQGLYVRSRKFYVEHLIFALHSHAAAYLLLLIALPFGEGFGRLILLLIPGWVVLALRRVYQQSYLKSALKTAVLAFLYSVLLVMSLGGTIAVAFLLA